MEGKLQSFVVAAFYVLLCYCETHVYCSDEGIEGLQDVLDISNEIQLHTQLRHNEVLKNQTNESSCEELRSKIFDNSVNTWVINNDTFHRLIERDIQRVVDCMDINSTIFFTSAVKIQPLKTIQIAKPMTLSALTQETDVKGEIYPLADNKVTFTCPSASQGVFIIKSDGVTLANIRIEECSLNYNTPVSVKDCNSTSQTGLRFHHLEFKNNNNSKDTSALEVTTSAATCGIISMIDVSFEGNVASEESNVIQLRSVVTMKDIRIIGNKGQKGVTEVLYYNIIDKRWKRDLTIENLVVQDNQTPVFRIKSGTLKILNANFLGNSRSKKGVYGIEQQYSLFKLRNLKEVQFKDCRFEDNTGLTTVMIYCKNVNHLQITDSLFRNNSNSEGAILATDSTLDVSNSSFWRNYANSSGAVFHLESSNGIIKSSVFANNTSELSGGALHISRGSSLRIEDSYFIRNAAQLGGACYGVNANISISNTKFSRNRAFSDGGAIHFERSKLDCTDTTFIRNSALDQGGACVFLDYSIVHWNSAKFTNNKATHGAAIYLFQSEIYGRNFTFMENTAEDGGGCLNVAHGSIVFNDTTFIENQAPYGGVIYAQAFNMTLTNVLMLRNSGGVNGGAISADKGNSVITNVTFIENKSALGGAMHIFNTNLTATELSFVNNSASEGSGLRCGDSTIHIHPREGFKSILPTDASISDGSSFGIFVHGNMAMDGRGALDLDGTTAVISYGTFSSNRGPDGAAIHFANEELQIEISHSLFKNNIANVGGGGISGSSTKQRTSLKLSFVNFTGGGASEGGALHLTSVNAEFNDCEFRDINARTGGAVFVEKQARITSQSEVHGIPNTIVSFTRCIFEDNTVLADGAAVFARGALEVQEEFIAKQEHATDPKPSKEGFIVSFHSVTMNSNRARDHGGGLYMDGGHISLHNVTITNNFAEWGGGIHLADIIGHLSNCKIQNNVAEWGGSGVNIEDDTSVRIEFTKLGFNEAKRGNGGALRLAGSQVIGEQLTFYQNKATSGGALRVNAAEKHFLSGEVLPVIDSSFLCTACVFINNTAKYAGGGLSIRSLDTGAPIVAQFQNCSFELNKAGSFGGAVHFVRPLPDRQCANWTSCGKLVITGSTFFENDAVIGGRAIHSNDRDRILFDCRNTGINSKKFITEIELSHFTNNTSGFCSNWQLVREANKTVPLVSTYVSRVEVLVEKTMKFMVENKWLLIKEIVPGSRLPEISLISYDEYNHSDAKSDRESFSAELKSKRKELFGNIRFLSDMSTGKGSFSGVKDPTNYSDFNGPYWYELEIVYNVDYLESQPINVSFRNCFIGEIKIEREAFCALCDSTEYNFDPEKDTCKICDDNMDCSSTYARPSPGYWHASPCHVPPKKCRTENACKKSEKVWRAIQDEKHSEIKEAIEQKTCNFSDKAIEQYQTAQCHKGYKGVLCGSCEKDYGRTANFECSKCSSVWLHLMGLFGTCTWMIAITALTIIGALQYREPPRVSQKLNARASQQFQQRDQPVYGLAKLLYNRRKHAARLKRSVRPITKRPGSRILRSLQPNSEAARENARLRLEHQCAQKRLCEILKIATNFLQAISIASVVNVNWRSYMLTMFSISSATGGSVSRLSSQAIQCLPIWNNSAAASIASLAAGFVIPMFIVVVYVMFFSLLTIVLYECLYYLITRSILSAVAVSYFSYLSISKAAVTGFGCVPVYTNKDYHSDDSTYYWVLDTSVKCFSMKHIWIMFFGALIFVFFTVGFPVFSARTLIYHRDWSESTKPQWIKDTMSFLYQAYDDQYVYWESVVMLRKAALSIVAVFSYHLSSNLLGLAATSVLTVCLYFQTLYNPYRAEFKSINRYERLSLLFSCIVFVLAQFFTEEGANSYLKDFLSILLLIIIAGFFMFMVHALVTSFFTFAKAELSLVGTRVEEGTGCVKILKLWLLSKIEDIKDKLQSLGIMDSSDDETTNLV
eukprot:g6002.t1